MYITNLKCEANHPFEWFFESREDMVRDLACQAVNCPECNSNLVTRAPTAPRVQTESRTVPLHVQRQVADYRQKVYRTADDVGDDLYQVTKNIRLGKEPDRPLVGSCTMGEAIEMKMNDVPLRPMPPMMDIEKN